MENFQRELRLPKAVCECDDELYVRHATERAAVQLQRLATRFNFSNSADL